MLALEMAAPTTTIICTTLINGDDIIITWQEYGDLSPPKRMQCNAKLHTSQN